MTMTVAKECADRYIQEHLGEEYAVDVKLDKDYEHYHLYFSLQRNGEIMNLPHKMRISGGKEVSSRQYWSACSLSSIIRYM